ncbi:histidine acid phosphatase superfamily [Trichinella spiralis]|nr:histidine acid phosphatase superfamily [Trichinella spiralis]
MITASSLILPPLLNKGLSLKFYRKFILHQ